MPLYRNGKLVTTGETTIDSASIAKISLESEEQLGQIKTLLWQLTTLTSKAFEKAIPEAD